MKPDTTLTAGEKVFGASAETLARIMPTREEIPEEFTSSRNSWVAFTSTWFFNGADTTKLVSKPGIDKNHALVHCTAIMKSWAPKHEHKIAAVSYLLSQWFDFAE